MNMYQAEIPCASHHDSNHEYTEYMIHSPQEGATSLVHGESRCAKESFCFSWWPPRLRHQDFFKAEQWWVTVTKISWKNDPSLASETMLWQPRREDYASETLSLNRPLSGPKPNPNKL